MPTPERGIHSTRFAFWAALATLVAAFCFGCLMPEAQWGEDWGLSWPLVVVVLGDAILGFFCVVFIVRVFLGAIRTRGREALVAAAGGVLLTVLGIATFAALASAILQSGIMTSPL